VGLSGLFLSVPFIAMSLYAGTVVDRVDRKKLLVWIEAANMLIIVAIALLVWSGWIQVWHIYLSNVLHALIGAFESPSRSALLPHLVPRSDLMTAISLHAVLRRGSQMVGPALGGISIAAIGVAGTYFIYAAAYSAMLTSILLIRTTNPASERAERAPLQAIAEGLRYVRMETIIGALLVLEFAINFFGSYNSMMVIFARDVFEAGPQGFGILQAASGLGTVVGSLVLSAAGDVNNKGRLVTAGGVIYGFAVLAFAFCPWFLIALPILAIAGAADILMGAVRMALIQLLARGEMLGRVMSLHAISTRGIGPFGGAQLGALTELVGVRSAVGFGGTICVAATLAAVLLLPALRSFSTPAGRGEASAMLGRPAARSTGDEVAAVR
jgi:MFS family permease